VLPGEHNTLDNAVQIKDPAISYAIYGTLHEAGEADYYTVTLRKGDPMEFSVLTPVAGSFAPWLIITGPGISPNGTVPQSVVVPAGETTTVVTGFRSLNPEYEPFTPMAMYKTAMFNGKAQADGKYIVAVYTPIEGGPYSLAAGTVESFTATEWIMLPISVINIRFWQEQSLLLIFGPYLLIIAIGLVLFFLRPGRKKISPAAFCGFLAGLLYIGTSAEILLQTGISLANSTAGLSVLVTMTFAMIALIAGAVAVLNSIRLPELKPIKFRVLMIVIGIVGLLAWSGLIIGPVLAFLAAIITEMDYKF